MSSSIDFWLGEINTRSDAHCPSLAPRPSSNRETQGEHTQPDRNGFHHLRKNRSREGESAEHLAPNLCTQQKNTGRPHPTAQKRISPTDPPQKSLREREREHGTFRTQTPHPIENHREDAPTREKLHETSPHGMDKSHKTPCLPS